MPGRTHASSNPSVGMLPLNEKIIGKINLLTTVLRVVANISTFRTCFYQQSSSLWSADNSLCEIWGLFKSRHQLIKSTNHTLFAFQLYLCLFRRFGIVDDAIEFETHFVLRYSFFWLAIFCPDIEECDWLQLLHRSGGLCDYFEQSLVQVTGLTGI